MLSNLPDPQTVFPAQRPWAIVGFWLTYWGVFFLLLPWMLIRQVALACGQAISVLRYWKREVVLIPDVLSLYCLNNLASVLITLIFGERFTLIRYRDVIIDPGPIFARQQIQALLTPLRGQITAVLVTHAHEEHIGNAALAAEVLGVPIYATSKTQESLRTPPKLSLPRRFFIGQPTPANPDSLRTYSNELVTPACRLQIVSSPGHCDGHVSLFDAENGILFAGDSFMHTIFTSPNVDVSAADWIETLRLYCQLGIRTMIGTHGLVYSCDPDIPELPQMVSRQEPLQLIQDKLRFLEWATDVVRIGEQRSLSYSVIEACLFPWISFWSWANWFGDESGRLFSAGEFSRTHFVRSLSATPERVPERFPFFAALIRRIAKQ